MSARKIRSDSVASQVKTFDQVRRAAPIPWPDTVEPSEGEEARDLELRLYNQVILMRPSDSWVPLDRHRAACLAQHLAALGRATKELGGELLVENDKGRLVASPWIHVADRMSMLCQTGYRQLGLNAQSTDRGLRTERLDYAREVAQQQPQGGGTVSNIWDGIG